MERGRLTLLALIVLIYPSPALFEPNLKAVSGASLDQPDPVIPVQNSDGRTSAEFGFFTA